MTVKLLAKQHLEFLSLKGGCTGLSESTLVKIPHCWKSHFTAQMIFKLLSNCLDPEIIRLFHSDNSDMGPWPLVKSAYQKLNCRISQP